MEAASAEILTIGQRPLATPAERLPIGQNRLLTNTWSLTV
jgi:hypothetical protein